MKTIGFLVPTTRDVWKPLTDAFEAQGVEKYKWKIGCDIGDDICIEYQSAGGQQKLYDEIAQRFASKKVDIIVTGGTGAALACQCATKEIPIVFATAGDPVACKLVASYDNPGANVTGISNQQTNLVIKRLDYMRDKLAPDLGDHFNVGVIGNTDVCNVALEMQIVEDVAATLGLGFSQCPPLQTQDDILPAIQNLKGQGAQALFVCTDPLITTNAEFINELALDEAIAMPTMHAFQENCGDKGLMFYGPSLPSMFELAGDIVERILRGDLPADIPVQQATTFNSHCNKKTAHILRLGRLVATLR
jgi:putative tryptophan/tyrosine transport system substrate-binding protein